MAIQQLQHAHGATIYPSDTENISENLQVYGRSTCLYVGTGGNLRVLTIGGDDVTFTNVQSGQFLPVMVTKVFRTGTTASNITVVDMGPGRFRGLLFDYSKRVRFDGGVVEAGSCVDAVSGLLLNASLLLVPSGYKGGKLYSEIPTNGNGDLTWTRGSDAFRTNADGLIQRVPWNLVQYSEEFSNAYWNKINSSTITANSITAPNGTLTADTLTVANSTYSGLGRAITGTSGNYNVSIYAKKNTKSWLYFIDVQGTGARAWFDLDNGVLGTVASGYTATITNVGDGWYRCTLSNNTAQTLAYYQIGLADANNGITPTIGSAYIWGAQLVEGTTAQTYFPTTDRLNVPRLSYMYGSCPAALLEPQRTNLVLYSEQFDNASWFKSSVSITANTTIAPDGNTTADTITTTAVLHSLAQSFTTIPNTTYTFSFWALRGTMTDLKYSVYNLTGASNIVAPTSYYSQTNSSTWSRINITFTAPVGCTSVNIYPVRDSGVTGTVYIWGAQAEQGAYPSTYIPTTSATATRVADSFSRSNIYTNGLISASGGTWFVELRGNIEYTRDSSINSFFVADTNLGSTNGFVFRNQGSANSRLFLSKRVSGTETTLYQTTTNTIKIAIKWNGSTADVFVNGTKQVSATAFTTTNMEFLIANGNDVPKFIQQMALFPSPLSDADCQLLTAL